MVDDYGTQDDVSQLAQDVTDNNERTAGISQGVEDFDNDEAVSFRSDDGSEEYAKIDQDGLHLKKIHIKNDSGLQSMIESEVGDTIDGEIVVLDDDNKIVGFVTKNGVFAKAYGTLDGYILPSVPDTCYISPNGNDSNSGHDTSHPKQSITGAINAGYKNIILLGGVYDQTIDTTGSSAKTISLKGARGYNIIFKKADSLIAGDGAETLVSGYTQVYKLTGVPAINYGAENGRAEWLFFDGLEDATTAISAQDAHPLERGRFYRCDCTKSVHTTATELSTAQAEIEQCGANEFKWFYNAGTQELYFNRPASTAQYPLYKSVGGYFTTRDNQSVELSNIEFRYGVVNLDGLNIVKVYNCASKYVYGFGAFTYRRTISIKFNKCEASSCFYGKNGDGFNADATSSGDDFAKCNQATFIDCWSHDNNDDGFSDHEYGESTIIGGLYEYNKKAGVTPSYGSQCSCYNVFSRHNYSGFALVGPVNDNGNSSQIICYGCISEQNDRGGNRAGFIVISSTGDSENRMVLYNCLAVNEVTGYKSMYSSILDAYDCKCINCTTQKEGTINVYNGTLLN